ncbi:hypothetical protein Pelo_14307 [Pelomyxa schiedti]|nr:hypothetical protein Pelo_14307 [Pelomyxa schiedti]
MRWWAGGKREALLGANQDYLVRERRPRGPKPTALILEDRATGHKVRLGRFKDGVTNGKWLVACEETSTNMVVFKLPRKNQMAATSSTTIKNPTVVPVDTVGYKTDFWIPEFRSIHEDYVVLCCYEKSRCHENPTTYGFLLVNLASTCASKKLVVLSSNVFRLKDWPPNLDDFQPLVSLQAPTFYAIDFITVEQGSGNKFQPTFQGCTAPHRVSQLNWSQFCAFRDNTDSYEVWDVRDAMKPVRTQKLLSGFIHHAFVGGGLLFQMSESLDEMHVTEESSGDHVVTFGLFAPIGFFWFHFSFPLSS